jgi:hypothetical protein
MLPPPHPGHLSSTEQHASTSVHTRKKGSHLIYFITRYRPWTPCIPSSARTRSACHEAHDSDVWVSPRWFTSPAWFQPPYNAQGLASRPSPNSFRLANNAVAPPTIHTLGKQQQHRHQRHQRGAPRTLPCSPPSWPAAPAAPAASPKTPPRSPLSRLAHASPSYTDDNASCTPLGISSTEQHATTSVHT